MRISFAIAFFLVPLSISASEEAARAALEANCFRCHGAEKQKGKVRFDTLSTDFINDRRAAETWQDALDAIQLGEMPPEDEEPLPDEDRRQLVNWLEEKLEQALEAHSSQSEGAVLRRMNTAEYSFTMRDLLGLEMDYSANLPPDPLSKDGFFTNGAALGMSAIQLEAYLETARKAMDFVLFEGSQPEETSLRIEPNYKPRGRLTKAGNPGNRLGRNHYWAGAVKGAPPSGWFTLRIDAHVDRETGQPDPVMNVRYGYGVPGLTVSFTDEFATQVIREDQKTVYEFSGWLDFSPQPGKATPMEKREGIIIITNALDDGLPAPKPIKQEAKKEAGKKKKKVPPLYPEDEDFPQLVINSVEFILHDHQSWPPKSHTDLIPNDTDLEDAVQLRNVISRFLKSAFRRPVGDPEVEKWFKYYQVIRSKEKTPIAALREFCSVVLASPEFLYLAEGKAGAEMNAHDLAVRLAYFLWSSMPDAKLTAAADSGALLKPDEIRSQFRRMMADPKSERFIEQFVSQWLDLGALDRVAINPQFYKDFDNDIKSLMIAETRQYFSHILRNDRSALELISSDYSLLNEKLGRHYGLAENDLPTGSDFRPVSFSRGQRTGGLLAHGAVHLSGSDGAHSHPIKRAVWIRERLLHDPPAPPPPNVPDISETVKNFDKLTVREQLEIHREKAACADCHRGIDPWGIALEHFDAIGLYRDKVAKTKKQVDAVATLPGGVEVKNLKDLQGYLVKNRADQFAEAITAKLLSYALGRSMEFSDEAAIEHLAEQFQSNDYSLRSLMESIVTSETFSRR